MKSIESDLIRKGIRPTPNRILIADCLSRFSHPVNMTQIGTAIDSVDKSSIFRVLTLFVEKDFVHVIHDGSGSLKYELCRATDGHSINDMHAHFRCENCGRIFCLESERIPQINIPEGFSLLTVNFVAIGLCRTCSGKL